MRAFALRHEWRPRQLAWWAKRINEEKAPIGVTDPCDDQAISSMQFHQAERVGLVAGFADHDASILAGRTAAVAMMQLHAEALWLCTAPMDMRAGVDKLSLHVQQALGRAPCDGTAYVFTNQRRSRLKLVCWDGTGGIDTTSRFSAGRPTFLAFLSPRPAKSPCPG